LLFKLLAYLGGFVTIAVSEDCLEKFLNMASTRGIYLWGIANAGRNRVELKVRLSSVQPLRHVARMTRCRFQIVERAGLPFFVGRMKRRKALLGGALFFVVVLYMLSSFVWFIDVTGNRSIAREQVCKAARQAGLYRGVPKWSVDTAKVEETVLRQVPGLSWVGVYVDGTRVRIKLVEKVLPPDTGQEKPADVVAVKDGLIKEILVLNGQPRVSEGDTVTAGQVLISAAVPPPDPEENLEPGEEPSEEPEQTQEPVKYVHARGIVRARVWYEDYKEMPLVERGVRSTGREITKLCMKIGGKEIIFMGPRQIPYEHFEAQTNGKRLPAWRNISIPVEFITVKYHEAKPYVHRYSKAQARRLASERALADIRSRMPAGARILKKQVQVVETNEPEDIVRVKVLVEALEEIGKERPHVADRGGSGIVDGKRGSQGNN